MKTHRMRPKWFILYLLIALLVGVMFLEARAPLSRTGHMVIEIFLVLLIYGGVISWLKANDSAILDEDLYKAGYLGRYTFDPAPQRHKASQESGDPSLR